MSTLEIRAHLHQVIANATNEEWLIKLFAWIQQNDEHKAFSEIPSGAMDAINAGISDIENGMIVSHEDMKKKYAAWLSM
jgi:predicted transcriptional regulator